MKEFKEESSDPKPEPVALVSLFDDEAHQRGLIALLEAEEAEVAQKERLQHHLSFRRLQQGVQSR